MAAGIQYQILLSPEHICLSNEHQNSIFEDIQYVYIDPYQLEELHQSILKASYCPHILNFEYVDYNNSRIAFSRHSTLEDAIMKNPNKYFGVGSDGFTEELKKLLGPILLAFDTLTKQGFYQVDDPRCIVFLEDDKDKKFPKVLMRSSNTCSEVKENFNFNQLNKLLRRLMCKEVAESKTVASFLKFLSWENRDFNVLYNHPALWSPGSSQRFADPANVYINEDLGRRNQMLLEIQADPNLVEFNGWENRLNKDLELCMQESLKHKNSKYDSDLIGLMEFQRNVYVHYNDKDHSNLNDYKTKAQLERMFVTLFPTILSAGYCFMFSFGFRFKE